MKIASGKTTEGGLTMIGAEIQWSIATKVNASRPPDVRSFTFEELEQPGLALELAEAILLHNAEPRLVRNEDGSRTWHWRRESAEWWTVPPKLSAAAERIVERIVRDACLRNGGHAGYKAIHEALRRFMEAAQ